MSVRPGHDGDPRTPVPYGQEIETAGKDGDLSNPGVGAPNLIHYVFSLCREERLAIAEYIGDRHAFIIRLEESGILRSGD